MRTIPTRLDGLILVEPDAFPDERGFFLETFNAPRYAEHGIGETFVQDNHSRSTHDTIRGLHYQAPPYTEVKIVRCTRGALYDVAVDLRPDSPTFGQWVGVLLTESDGRALYIPRGFAHGFLSRRDATEAEYQISAPYVPEAARGLRWDDPFFGVEWPGPVEVIAERDRGYPDVDVASLQALRGLWENE